MKVREKAIIIIFLVIIMFPHITMGYVAPQKGYWKNAWDNLKNIKLSSDIATWPVPDVMGNIISLSDDDLKKLDNEQWDRAAFLKILEKYLDDTGVTSGAYGKKVAEILDRMKNLDDYYEQQGKAYIDGEKEILGIPIVDENGDEHESDIITSGESEKNNQRIEEINYILETGIENGNVITDERRKELEEERDRLTGENNERHEATESDKSILDRKPIGLLPTDTSDGKITVDETIEGAMNFINSGKDQVIEQSKLQEVTKTLYNVLLIIAMTVAIITGLIIGIKFITSSVEGKAEVKKILLPYIISCAVTFGAFGIWKLVIQILNNLE